MKKLLIISSLILMNISLFAEDATHSLRLKGAYGQGTIGLAERNERDHIENGKSLYLNALNPSLSNPYVITSQDATERVKAAMQLGFEYRFRDNLRINVGYRDLSAEYGMKTQHIPGFIFDPTSDMYQWKEVRKNVGLEYYIPFGDFIKFGPLVKYYMVDQNYTNEVVRYFDNTYTSGSTSLTATNTQSGTQTSYGKYSGFAPGMAIEFKITDWFRVGVAGEYILWKGTKTTELPYYTSSSITGVGSSTTGGYFSDSGDMAFNGFFGDLTLQFRPFSLLGITLGYHRENYNRKYRNYSYSTSATEYIVSSSIYSSLVKSSNPKFTSEVYYLQAELILDL
ncbi:MAG: hypothetical protein KDK36_12035 [Leptospiraceae bacterium]|nr:hypothetical protein [Leptospiraceae bacterium]